MQFQLKATYLLVEAVALRMVEARAWLLAMAVALGLVVVLEVSSSLHLKVQAMGEPMQVPPISLGGVVMDMAGLSLETLMAIGVNRTTINRQQLLQHKRLNHQWVISTWVSMQLPHHSNLVTVLEVR